MEYRQDVYCYGITDIICQAPIALKEKDVLLHYLMKKRNMKSDIYNHAYRALKRKEKWKKIKKDVRDMADWAYDDGWSYMWEACEDINEAIKMLDDYLTEYEGDGEFYLFSEWYDTDSFVEKSFGQGLFSSMKEVMDYIDNEIEENLRKMIVNNEFTIIYGGERIELWYLSVKTINVILFMAVSV